MSLDSESQKEALAKIRKSLTLRAPRVLLVEDFIPDAELTWRTLKSFGISCVWRQTAEAAVSYIEEHEVDLVFLDLKLSGPADGLGAISKIITRWPSCWIIVLSGVYQEDSRECKEALRLGAGAVILKPLSKEKVQLVFGRPLHDN